MHCLLNRRGAIQPPFHTSPCLNGDSCSASLNASTNSCQSIDPSPFSWCTDGDGVSVGWRRRRRQLVFVVVAAGGGLVVVWLWCGCGGRWWWWLRQVGVLVVVMVVVMVRSVVRCRSVRCSWWVWVGIGYVGGLDRPTVTSHAEKMASTSCGAGGMFQLVSAVRISSLSMRPLRSCGGVGWGE